MNDVPLRTELSFTYFRISKNEKKTIRMFNFQMLMGVFQIWRTVKFNTVLLNIYFPKVTLDNLSNEIHLNEFLRKNFNLEGGKNPIFYCITSFFWKTWNSVQSAIQINKSMVEETVFVFVFLFLFRKLYELERWIKEEKLGHAFSSLKNAKEGISRVTD